MKNWDESDQISRHLGNKSTWNITPTGFVLFSSSVYMVIVFSAPNRGGCVLCLLLTVHWYNQDISCFHVMLPELWGQIVVSSCAGFYPHNNRLSSTAWSQPWSPALLVEPERREIDTGSLRQFGRHETCREKGVWNTEYCILFTKLYRDISI